MVLNQISMEILTVLFDGPPIHREEIFKKLKMDYSEDDLLNALDRLHVTGYVSESFDLWEITPAGLEDYNEQVERDC